MCNSFFGRGKPSKSRGSCEDRPIQGYKNEVTIMRSLFAIPLAFCSLFSCLIWTIRTTNESRRFSLETDIRVWKNAARCFINNVSKNQTEKNDLRPIVLSKIINHLLFICFLNLFHSILFYFFYFRLLVGGEETS